MAYRWFANDAISFAKSLDWPSATGPTSTHVPRAVQQAGNRTAVFQRLLLYQDEPHPRSGHCPRRQAGGRPRRPLWLHPEVLPGKGELQQRGVKLYVTCGRPAARSFCRGPVSVRARERLHLHRWPPPVYYCRADDSQLEMDVKTPAKASGKLRLFIPGSRHVQGRPATGNLGGGPIARGVLGIQGRQVGRMHRTAEMNPNGKVPIRVKSSNGNAVGFDRRVGGQ